MIGLILAGGEGTRLKSVLQDKPKPMAPVNNKPFIRYLTDYLFLESFSKIYISCFYLWEQIEKEYLYEIKFKQNIELIVEPKKLGTGGAIFYSLKKIFEDNKNTQDVIILNGDSFIKINFDNFFTYHKVSNLPITIASTNILNTGRYGILNIDSDNIITSFEEKNPNNININSIKAINTGVYIINKSIGNLFNDLYNNINEFSFENKILTPLAEKKLLRSYNVNNNFIDIGIPEDYLRVADFFEKELS